MSKTKQKTLDQEGSPVRQGFQQRAPKTVAVNARHEITVLATVLKHWDAEGVVVKTQSDIVIYALRLVYHHISRTQPKSVVSNTKEGFDLMAERGLMQKRNFNNPAVKQDLALSGTSVGIQSLLVPEITAQHQKKLDKAFFKGSEKSVSGGSVPEDVEFAAVKDKKEGSK